MLTVFSAQRSGSQEECKMYVFAMQGPALASFILIRLILEVIQLSCFLGQVLKVFVIKQAAFYLHLKNVIVASWTPPLIL